MRCSVLLTLFGVIPFHFLWTILGTIWYSDMIRSELTCVRSTSFSDNTFDKQYPDYAAPWLVPFALAMSYFLIFVYSLIICSFGMQKVRLLLFHLIKFALAQIFKVQSRLLSSGWDSAKWTEWTTYLRKHVARELTVPDRSWQRRSSDAALHRHRA